MTFDLAALTRSGSPLDQVLNSGSSQAQPAVDPLMGGTRIDRGEGTSAVFGLGQDDFFRLFLAQLQNQDPTQPMDNKDLLAQIGQFSMIDTLQQVQKALGGSQLAQGSALIGKAVAGVGVDGLPVSGVVDRLIQDTTGLYLIVGDRAIKPEGVAIVSSPIPAA